MDVLLAGTEDLIHLHAAAVIGPRACALLVGESGSGKSTLSFGLRRLGLSPLSDDLAIIDPASGCLVPFLRSLRLHRQALQSHDGLEDLAQDTHFCEPYLWAHPGATAELEPLKPTDLVFLRHAGVTELTELTPTEALPPLLRGRFGPGGGARDFECCRQLIAATRCYRLSIGDFADALDRLASQVFGLVSVRA